MFDYALLVISCLGAVIVGYWISTQDEPAEAEIEPDPSETVHFQPDE